MTDSSDDKIIDLQAFRERTNALFVPDGARLVPQDHATRNKLVIEDMPFDAVAEWLINQAQAKGLVAVQAHVTFSGKANGSLERLEIPDEPSDEMTWAMPFAVQECATEINRMLRAYDLLVSESRFPAETILGGFSDGWVALESTDEIHSGIPSDAYARIGA